MRRPIEWVDSVFVTLSGTDLRPSRLLKLVEDVRTEALDAVELALHKQGDYAEGSDARALQQKLLTLIGTWRNQR